MSKSILNTNAIWGQVYQPKTSNDMITYLGDYYIFEEIDTKKFSYEVLVWHTPKFSKEEWRYGLYGIKTKPTWDYVEEENVLTLELNYNIKKIHFITYGDDNFKKSKARILKEAEEFGEFTTITGYGPEDLDNNFKKKYKDILKEKRGGGYWIWRPYILNKKFQEIEDDDIIIFLDAGCTINHKGKNKFYEYINMFNNTDNGIISIQYNNGDEEHPHLEEKYWSTNEIFKYFNIEFDNKIINSCQYLGGVLILKKNKHSRLFIDTFLKVLEDNPYLFTDKYNNNQLPEFIDNRHDQSISSIIRKRIDSIVLNSSEIYSDNSLFKVTRICDLI